jgi:hypothetical protein
LATSEDTHAIEYPIALSGNGNTAVLDDYVYARSGTSWTRQGTVPLPEGFQVDANTLPEEAASIDSARRDGHLGGGSCRPRSLSRTQRKSV